jgi:putative flippase GtrA
VKYDKRLVRQVVLYGVIGGASALLDYSLFTVMYKIAGMNKLIANIVSVHAGIATSFILNRRYNFRKTDKIVFRAGAFYLTGLFGIGLSTAMLWIGGMIGLPVLPVKFVSIFIVAAVQFTLNKLIAFGK